MNLLDGSRSLPWEQFKSEDDVIAWLWSYWGSARGPLTWHETAKWRNLEEKSAPVRGLRVLHCLPTFLTTLLKLDHLRSMVGADIVCCESAFVRSDAAAHRLLSEFTSFRLVSQEEAVAMAARHPFDVVLDTGGELAGRVVPRVGVVELTQTGEQRYRELETRLGGTLPYSVVSVDASRLKRIEDRLGSADGFLRALRMLTDFDRVTDASNNHDAIRVCVLGFGKVGVGICDLLRQRGVALTVIDVATTALESARNQGMEALHFERDEAAVKARFATAWAVVTCTGVKHLLQHYKVSDFAEKTHFLNMGVHDEFGPGFPAERCLWNKEPVNFALEEPTLYEYLDPAFTASQEAIPYLLQFAKSDNQEGSRVHALPRELDERILGDWEKYHGKKLPF